jgi:hypothetical protein
MDEGVEVMEVKNDEKKFNAITQRKIDNNRKSREAHQKHFERVMKLIEELTAKIEKARERMIAETKIIEKRDINIAKLLATTPKKTKKKKTSLEKRQELNAKKEKKIQANETKRIKKIAKNAEKKDKKLITLDNKKRTESRKVVNQVLAKLKTARGKLRTAKAERTRFAKNAAKSNSSNAASALNAARTKVQELEALKDQIQEEYMTAKVEYYDRFPQNALERYYESRNGVNSGVGG